MLVKISVVTVMLLVCMLAFASVCSAATPTDDHVGTADNGGYIVKPAKSGNGNVGILTISDTITQGETNWHYKVVSEYITTLNVDLNWGYSANSLQLTIYSPDNHVFGPYYDRDDGTIDGRINLDIYNPNGIAQGTWSYKVYGYYVSGVQSYTI